ncbi:GntR family transcriptional regulator [Nocardiopsis terrae]|uniref:GntR family transcriptional regulator/MocR family aminotransferase n=1 Tax=Nocardiopsis terrae TaxID=372655 RepID=A0ABR9HAV2_9ACTN|nr:PLP-dependent aminotransferase family protein [Nocardiopsis terrae]MBE1456145.1 GntR family transcriptional regulator/MocR family aminotransferase [Nocardiopsis terrae]GHC97871.1 GntR family transcriptional regulator [Nocardiopsis terrae]
MPRHVTEPPVRLDRSATVPLTAQLSGELREAMSSGALRAGERLPSSRALATQLGVSRTVVTDAYQQLYAEGWLDGRHGSGTFVAEHEPLPDRREGLPAAPERRAGPQREAETVRGHPSREQLRRDAVVNLLPGAPWVHGHDRAALRRAWRHAAEQPPSDAPDPRGRPELRALLAEHLRRTRGVRVGPENILVTRGTGNGLDLVGAVLGPGIRAGVEDPGYGRARSILAARGAEIVPCPVDHDGIRTEDLPDDLSVVYTTPAHQYPLGGRLPLPRRERLLAWARRTGALVVEDDYDAEFRYDVAPLPALYGLDPERVVLLGTLSKTLDPDLGIGWIVAEPALLQRLVRARTELSDRTSGPPQAATALLLERGDLDRHLRRMRLEYARRRSLLVEHLGPRLTGDTAGLHVLLRLPEAAVAPVIRAAAEEGVLVEDTSRTSHGAPTVHGLVIGYGSADRGELRRACRVLARAVERYARA